MNIQIETSYPCALSCRGPHTQLRIYQGLRAHSCMSLPLPSNTKIMKITDPNRQLMNFFSLTKTTLYIYFSLFINNMTYSRRNPSRSNSGNFKTLNFMMLISTITTSIHFDRNFHIFQSGTNFLQWIDFDRNVRIFQSGTNFLQCPIQGT